MARPAAVKEAGALPNTRKNPTTAPNLSCRRRPEKYKGLIPNHQEPRQINSSTPTFHTCHHSNCDCSGEACVRPKVQIQQQLPRVVPRTAVTAAARRAAVAAVAAAIAACALVAAVAVWHVSQDLQAAPHQRSECNAIMCVQPVPSAQHHAHAAVTSPPLLQQRGQCFFELLNAQSEAPPRSRFPLAPSAGEPNPLPALLGFRRLELGRALQPL